MKTNRNILLPTMQPLWKRLYNCGQSDFFRIRFGKEAL